MSFSRFVVVVIDGIRMIAIGDGTASTQAPFISIGAHGWPPGRIGFLCVWKISQVSIRRGKVMAQVIIKLVRKRRKKIDRIVRKYRVAAVSGFGQVVGCFEKFEKGD